MRRVLRPALEAGQVVISDRYSDATVAYQGAGRGFSPELVSQIVELATEGLKPNLTLLFDLPVETCLERTRRRTEGKHKGDRLDAENSDFHSRVRQEYLRIAEGESERVKIVDSSGSVEYTHKRVKEIVIPFLESRDCRLRGKTGGGLRPQLKTGHC